MDQDTPGCQRPRGHRRSAPRFGRLFQLRVQRRDARAHRGPLLPFAQAHKVKGDEYPLTKYFDGG